MNTIETELLNIGYYNLIGNTNESNEIMIGSKEVGIISKVKELLVDKIKDVSTYNNNFILYKNTIKNYENNTTLQRIFLKLSKVNDKKYILIDLIYDNKKLIDVKTKEYDNYNFDDINVPVIIKKVINDKLLKTNQKILQ